MLGDRIDCDAYGRLDDVHLSGVCRLRIGRSTGRKAIISVERTDGGQDLIRLAAGAPLRWCRCATGELLDDVDSGHLSGDFRMEWMDGKHVWAAVFEDGEPGYGDHAFDFTSGRVIRGHHERLQKSGEQAP